MFHTKQRLWIFVFVIAQIIGCHSEHGPEPRVNKLKEQEVLAFIPEAHAFVDKFFNLPNTEIPRVFFDYERVGRQDPEFPGGALFFDQQTQKYALYVNPDYDKVPLKPLIVHEMTHYFQHIVEKDRREPGPAINPEYGLSDYRFALNILREGHAEYVAKQWAIKNQTAFNEREVEATLKTDVAALHPILWSGFVTNFRYAFGYRYFKKINANLNKKSQANKIDILLKDATLTTTTLFNDYLGLSMSEFKDFDVSKLIMRKFFAKDSDPLIYLGAATLVFYVTLANFNFEESLDVLRATTKISGIGNVENNSLIVMIETAKSSEIARAFKTNFTVASSMNISGYDVTIVRFAKEYLHVLVKGSITILLQQKEILSNTTIANFLNEI